MKKRRFRAKEPKQRQQIPPNVAATLRGYIANTWLVIGSLRKKSDYDTNRKPWNPCLRAQQNYVAWCRKHEVNPECWDNFVYYFSISRLFWKPFSDGLGGPSMPAEGISLASMELEIADGAANWNNRLFGIDQTPKHESLGSYKDLWHVVLTARASAEDGTEEFYLKKKLIIEANSFTVGDKPIGPQWSVSYQNPDLWCGTRYRSRTKIEYVDTVHSTSASYGQWWKPVVVSLQPESRMLSTKLHVQVQPLTHRGRHEIQNNLYPNYED